MNILIHLIIARKIYNRVDVRTRTTLNFPAFFIGNIWPDFDRQMASQPHDFEPAADAVSLMAERAAGLRTAGQFFKKIRKSFLMGNICHYLADFCCFAHSKRFDGDWTQHYAYEFKMFLHISEANRVKIYRSALSWRHQESIRIFLNKAQSFYLADTVDYTTDLAHAVNLGTIVMKRLSKFKSSCLAEEGIYELSQPAWQQHVNI